MFWIYGSSAIDNQSNIYVRITLNGKRVNLSLKQKIDIDSWYPKRQRVKGNSSDARQINAYLDNVKSELVQSYRDLKSEKTVLTPQLIKSRYLGEDKKEHTLKDIFKYNNELMLDKHSSKTQYHYRTTQKYLLTYFDSKLNLQNINLQKLNYELVIGFESFLRGFVPKHYRKKIQNNAVMKHIQRLKHMTSLAHDIEWIDFNPFVKFKLKLEKKERKRFFDRT